jgi:hypothetical protein
MSTLSEHEAILRRALRATAEAIEPGRDGLDRIQARLRPPRPLLVAWIEALWTDLVLRAPVSLHAAQLRLSHALRSAWDRFGPAAGATGPGRAHPSLGWLRPLAAMSVAVFVVAAGAYVAIEVPQAVSPNSSNAPYAHNGGTSSTGGNLSGPQTAGSQASSFPPVAGLVNPSGPAGGSDCKTAAIKPPSISAGTTPSPSTSPSTSTSPSPSPSTSPSQTGTPSPSPSGSSTSSPDPSSSASTAATDSAAGQASANASENPSSGSDATVASTLSSTMRAGKASPSPCGSTSSAAKGSPGASSAAKGSGTTSSEPSTAAQKAQPEVIAAAKIDADE